MSGHANVVEAQLRMWENDGWEDDDGTEDSEDDGA